MALATTRGVAPAATTLTRPPAGRSRSASRASALAASSRDGATSVAAMLADASTTITRSRASVAGRSTNGWAARSAEEEHEEELEEEQERAAQALPRRVRLEVLAEALPEERRAHGPLRAAQLEHPEGDRRAARRRGRGAPAARRTASARLLPDHPPAPQLGEDEVGERDVGGERHVRDPALRGERGEVGPPGLDPLGVALAGGEVEGDVDGRRRSPRRRGGGRPRGSGPARRGRGRGGR